MAAAIASNPRLSIVYMPKVFAPEIQAKKESQEADRDAATRFARSVYNRMLTAQPGERAAFVEDYQFRIDPVHDDRPFFFEYFKPGAHLVDPNTFSVDLNTIRGPAGYYVLYLLLATSPSCQRSCVSVPLWMFQRPGLNFPGAVPLVLFFACLGRPDTCCLKWAPCKC